MKKITTLFKKDPMDLGRVINELNPENQWVMDREGIATRKFDGTPCMIKNSSIYKRYDVKLWKKKRGKIITFTEKELQAKIPTGAIPCQDPDPITGHWPHWVLCDRDNPADKYFFEAFDNQLFWEIGTYELCGPKINGNPEKFKQHILIPHGFERVKIIDFSFESIKNTLSLLDIEGIVFHHSTDGRMCKIRKTDFGLKR